MAIGSKLHAIGDSGRHILHEKFSGSGSAISNGVGNDELRFSVNGGPGPDVPCSRLHLFLGDILLLRIDELPDFIALDTASLHIPDVGIMVGCAGAPNVLEQFQDGMLCNSGHAAGGINRTPLYQGRHYLGSSFSC
jgi:hypothetical protein